MALLQTLNNFLTTVKKFLKPSGYLLITTFDGTIVNNSFDETNHITSYYTTQEGEKKILFDVIKNQKNLISFYTYTIILPLPLSRSYRNIF